MDTNRRQLLLGCGAGALGAMRAPAPCWADRLRVLGEPVDVERPAPGGQVSPDFQRWMSAVRVGQAAAQDGLLVFWLARQGAVARARRRDAGRGAQIGRAPDHRARSGDRARAGRRESRQGPRPAPGGRDPDRGQAEPRAARGHPAAAALAARARSVSTASSRAAGTRAARISRARAASPSPALRSKLMERPNQGRVWDSVARPTRAAEVARLPHRQLPGHLRRRQGQGAPRRDRARGDLCVPPAARPRRRRLRRALARGSTSSTPRRSSRANGPSCCARTRSRPTGKITAARRSRGEAPRPGREPARPGRQGRGLAAGATPAWASSSSSAGRAQRGAALLYEGRAIHTAIL